MKKVKKALLILSILTIICAFIVVWIFLICNVGIEGYGTWDLLRN